MSGWAISVALYGTQIAHPVWWWRNWPCGGMGSYRLNSSGASGSTPKRSRAA